MNLLKTYLRQTKNGFLDAVTILAYALNTTFRHVPNMRRFRSRRRVNFRGIRRLVRGVTGVTLTKRILFAGLTIPDVTAADWDTALSVDLIECVEAQDEEVETDGTAIADVPLYSRLLSMKLRMMVLGASGQTNVYRWLLYKKPDGEAIAGTDLTAAGASFHTSNDTPTAREVRKYTLAKGIIVSNPSSAIANLSPYVSRAAWARASPMREGDKLCFLIAKDAAGTTSILHGMGNIYVKANA